MIFLSRGYRRSFLDKDLRYPHSIRRGLSPQHIRSLTPLAYSRIVQMLPGAERHLHDRFLRSYRTRVGRKISGWTSAVGITGGLLRIPLGRLAARPTVVRLGENLFENEDSVCKSIAGHGLSGGFRRSGTPSMGVGDVKIPGELL